MPHSESNNIGHGEFKVMVTSTRCCTNGIATDYVRFIAMLDLWQKKGWDAAGFHRDWNLRTLGSEVYITASIKQKGFTEWKHYVYNMTEKLEQKWDKTNGMFRDRRNYWQKNTSCTCEELIQMELNGIYPCDKQSIYEVVFKATYIADDNEFNAATPIVDWRGKPIDGRSGLEKYKRDFIDSDRPLTSNEAATFHNWGQSYFMVFTVDAGQHGVYVKNCVRQFGHGALESWWDDGEYPVGDPRAGSVEIQPLGTDFKQLPENMMNAIYGGQGTPGEFGSNWANGQEYSVVSLDDPTPECGDCGYGGYGYGGALDGAWCVNYGNGVCDGAVGPGGAAPSNWDVGGPTSENGNCKYTWEDTDGEGAMEWVYNDINDCTDGYECPDDVISSFPEGTVEGQNIYTGCIPEE